MNEDRQTQAKTSEVRNYGDEIELMDYLIVIWKWKYLILAGTFAFALVVTIISFITLKQQPTMYRTSILLKPFLLKVDEEGKKDFIDTPENIKALIENELKFKVLEQLKKSINLKQSTSLNFQIDIQKGSDITNVSLDSVSADESTAKLNYLIKLLMSVYSNKLKYVKNEYDKTILLKKYKLEILSFKIKKITEKIKKYEKELSEIEAKRKLLKERRDNSPSREYFLDKLSVENDYFNTFQIYFDENEYAKINLFEIQIKTKRLSKEIEKLEREKNNSQIIQVIQPPVTTELPQKNKISLNIILSLVVGFLLMLFLSFFLEYLNNYKKRVNNK